MFLVRKDRLQIVVVLLMILLVACATTPLGKAVQIADTQKRLIELSAVEFAKLHLKGVTDAATHERGKQAYQEWSKAQTALTESLVAWKIIGDADSSKRLSEALSVVNKVARAYIDFIGQFVDLDKIRKQIGG